MTRHAPSGRCGSEEVPVSDVIYILLILAFFLIAWLLVRAFDRM